MTSRLTVTAVALAVTVLSGCVVPARDDAAYRTNATQALQSATSEARTAELTLRHWLAGDVTTAYADTVVTESEKALGPIQTSFGAPDPSSRAVDALREDVTGRLSDTESALALSRIALRRGDRDGVRQGAVQLDRLTAVLDQAAERLK
jgi:hypothetical protein